MEIAWRRSSVIGEDIIAEAEKQFGIQLPDDIKKVFVYANNGRPSVCTFDSPKSKEHVLKKLLSFKKDDIENVYKAKAVVDNDDKSLFPLANDPSGNLICLKNNIIVYWHHETGEVEFLANSFAEFLNSLY
jgi:cell wall assembly regulator SMI1